MGLQHFIQDMWHHMWTGRLFWSFVSISIKRDWYSGVYLKADHSIYSLHISVSYNYIQNIASCYVDFEQRDDKSWALAVGVLGKWMEIQYLGWKTAEALFYLKKRSKSILKKWFCSIWERLTELAWIQRIYQDRPSPYSKGWNCLLFLDTTEPWKDIKNM